MGFDYEVRKVETVDILRSRDADGSIYIGGWSVDEAGCGGAFSHRHGHGKETKPDGSWYEGQWADDKPHSKNLSIDTLVYPGGDVRYEGKVAHGKPHGEGKMEFTRGDLKGSRIEGEFDLGRFASGVYVSMKGEESVEIRLRRRKDYTGKTMFYKSLQIFPMHGFVTHAGVGRSPSRTKLTDKLQCSSPLLRSPDSPSQLQKQHSGDRNREQQHNFLSFFHSCCFCFGAVLNWQSVGANSTAGYHLGWYRSGQEHCGSNAV